MKLGLAAFAAALICTATGAASSAVNVKAHPAPTSLRRLRLPRQRAGEGRSHLLADARVRVVCRARRRPLRAADRDQPGVRLVDQPLRRRGTDRPGRVGAAPGALDDRQALRALGARSRHLQGADLCLEPAVRVQHGLGAGPAAGDGARGSDPLDSGRRRDGLSGLVPQRAGQLQHPVHDAHERRGRAGVLDVPPSRRRCHQVACARDPPRDHREPAERHLGHELRAVFARLHDDQPDRPRRDADEGRRGGLERRLDAGDSESAPAHAGLRLDAAPRAPTAPARVPALACLRLHRQAVRERGHDRLARSAAPAWAPRDSDPLALPTSLQDLQDANGGKFLGFGSQSGIFMRDGTTPAASEEQTADGGAGGSPAGASGAAGPAGALRPGRLVRGRRCGRSELGTARIAARQRAGRKAATGGQWCRSASSR